MILVAGVLIGLFVVTDEWTLPVIAGAIVLEVAETFMSFKLARRFGPARVGPERLIGATGRVVAPCRPLGRVRVHGELWQARCEVGAELDERVRVTGRHHLILNVERVEGGEAIALHGDDEREGSVPSSARN